MYRNFRPNNQRNKHVRKSLPSQELLSAIRSVEVIKKNKVEEEEIPTTHSGFADFHLVPGLLSNIEHKGYEAPTPIQDKAILPILEGHDVIGIANTGTGKTAAFLIPLVDAIYRNKSERAIIIAPTRELAVQIFEELKGFNRGLGMYTVLCIGGMSLNRQKGDLRQNPHVVIGTPGRIKDLIGERALDLSRFGIVVLDEADRMVDIGFINDIKYFISLLPLARQSLFFSATISGKVQEILKAFVKNPITVSVKQQDTAENISQDVIHVTSKERKIDQLHNLLSGEGFDKVLIFGRTKWGVQKLSDELVKRGFRAGAIHGNKSQNHRQKVLDQFKKGEIKILLATDVASRGLDIPDVTHVINYEMPENMESYVHRIGRTGRAEKKGKAITFVG
ncbi:MAG TPA: DEAD/DEAH box helicase [Candidatus Eisenbacteria bacterium]|nr:DEAD/DEAH box helicase [Candidatus Eisenbacteria bacterium]